MTRDLVRGATPEQEELRAKQKRLAELQTSWSARETALRSEAEARAPSVLSLHAPATSTPSTP